MKSLEKIKNLKNGKVLVKMSRMKVCVSVFVLVWVSGCECVCVCDLVCFPIKVGGKNLRVEERKITLE